MISRIVKIWTRILVFLGLREDPQTAAERKIMIALAEKTLRALDEKDAEPDPVRFTEYEDEIPESQSKYLISVPKPAAIALSETGEELTVYSAELSLAENPYGEPHTEEIGSPGIYFSKGIPSSIEPNPTFRPIRARGSRRDHGTFHKFYLTSTTYRRGVNNIAQALVTGNWNVRPGTSDDMSPQEIDEAKRRSRWTERHLLHALEGGFSQFIQDWSYCLVSGFALFETVYYGMEADEDKRGAIRKLAFRMPNAVREWIQDEYERDLVAVMLSRPNGEEYVLPASSVLLYSYNRYGNNYEGSPPMRSAARWIEALQALSLQELNAAEKFGSPHTFVTGDLDKSQREEIKRILDAAIGLENPVYTLPAGASLGQTNAGNMPIFESAKRFCLERIGEILKAEGSLIGLGQTGAFAARASADGEFIRSAPYFGRLVTDPLNGANNTPYTGVIPKMECAHFGDPLRPGLFSRVEYSIGELEDAGYAQRLATLAGSGFARPNEEVIAHIHEREKLPEPEPAQTVETESNAPRFSAFPGLSTDEVNDAV